MNNQRLAALFYELADLLDILGVQWKPIAFRKAARNIETLKDDVADIYQKGGLEALEAIPGVGEAIAKKTVEFFENGTFKELEKTRKQLPKGIVELMQVRGVGPKSVKILYGKLKITTLKQLEDAAKQGKIRKLEGFGEKSEADILEGIALLRKGRERLMLGEVLPIAREIEERLRQVKGVGDVMIGGSVRRRRETCKDIDVLATAKNPIAIMDAFVALPDVMKVTGKGLTKSSIILDNGLAVDLRVVQQKCFGAALQYFTGSKEHNVHLRQIAIKKGYSLSEYGLFTKAKKYVCGRTEEEIYKKLAVPFAAPEIRENAGEFEGKIPALIDYEALKGDLHMHTLWSDGATSPEMMVAAAKKLGYEYLAITDHSGGEIQANGMDKKRLLQYVKVIRKVATESDIRVFVGSEVDIKPDGSLDYDDELLQELDIVVASVHNSFKMERGKMTQRLLKAIDNKHVTILGHASARLINERPPIEFDMDKVFEAAKDRGILLEVNGNPHRLDLNDVMCRHAKESGCTFVIDTDAHHPDQLLFAEYGIATARRGWLEAKDVANTLGRKRFEKLVGK